MSEKPGASAVESPAREVLRAFAAPTLWLLLLPALSVALASTGARRFDREVLDVIASRIDADASIPADERESLKAQYGALPPTATCDNDDPRLADYRQNVCAPWSDLWQFVWVGRLAWAALVAGVLSIVFAGAMGLLAYAWPAGQYLVLVGGSRVLMFATAAQVVVQGGLAVWDSFWATAIFFHVYVVKLIVIIGVFAAMGVFAAIRGIWPTKQGPGRIEGELLESASMPALWSRLQGLAGKVGTAPPANVIGGIDDNFFVTEAPLEVGGRTLTGRSLFVSLPLLRLLRGAEADAVLSHELAHFRGGDTASSARLGPALNAFDRYLAVIRQELATIPAAAVLRLFRVLFELGHRRASRAREYVADATAAAATSAEDLSRALLKVVAYASHRAATEQGLFDAKDRLQGALGLAGKLAEGVAAFARTEKFRDNAASMEVPHPFDSHPPVLDRLGRLGSTLRFEDCAGLLDATSDDGWLHGQPAAAEAEQRLWDAYEARFREAHERRLAWESAPATDEERAIVVKHFPPVSFAGTAAAIEVTHEGIRHGDAALLRFDDIADARIDDGNFSTVLLLTHKLDGAAGKGQTRVDLRALGPQRAAFEEAFGKYFARARHSADVVRARAAVPAEERPVDAPNGNAGSSGA